LSKKIKNKKEREESFGANFYVCLSKKKKNNGPCGTGVTNGSKYKAKLWFNIEGLH